MRGSQSWLQPPFEAAPRSTTETDLDTSFTQQTLLSYSQIMPARNVARRRRSPRPWKPVTSIIVLRPSADALADVRPLLARITDALGTNAAARLLGADRAQVSRWTART